MKAPIPVPTGSQNGVIQFTTQKSSRTALGPPLPAGHLLDWNKT